MHVIAAKAVALKMAMEPEFKDRQERTIRGAQALTERLMAEDSKAAGVGENTTAQGAGGGETVYLEIMR